VTRWLLGLIVCLALATGYAQSSAATYRYASLRLKPSQLKFKPTSSEMMCASWLNPTSNSSGVTVSGFTPPGCPQQPPVVVWDKGKRYSIRHVQIYFYGPGTYQNQATGVSALVSLLKSNYQLRLLASGDLSVVKVQYEPPARQKVKTPVPDSPDWQDWQTENLIEIGKPKVKNATNHGANYRVCKTYFNHAPCWSARLKWAVPVRLVLEGNEPPGSYTVVVTLPKESISPQQGILPLSVHGDALQPARILPLPEELLPEEDLEDPDD